MTAWFNNFDLEQVSDKSKDGVRTVCISIIWRFACLGALYKIRSITTPYIQSIWLWRLNLLTIHLWESLSNLELPTLVTG